MKIKFLGSFQGVETGGIFYEQDQVVELDDGVASRLVMDGRAVLVSETEIKQPAPVEKEIPAATESSFEQSRKRGRK